MRDEEHFEPRLGRLRARGAKQGRRFLNRVIAATNITRGAGPADPSRRRSASGGSRHAAGAGVGRLLASRSRVAAPFRRRVVVKARIVRLAGKGVSAARAHLRYLLRESTTRDGDRGALYSSSREEIDAGEFHARGVDDRHQFRFIVSPEDGGEYQDLKPLVRRLMARAEVDLGTKLDWVAVDHFDTGHPHAHIVVRGRDDRAKDLVIARDYLTRGLRARAVELVELDLGPRDPREVARAMIVEIEQERMTQIDRRLVASADADRIVSTQGLPAFEQTLRIGRLATLARMGLAAQLEGGQARLAPDLEVTLARMGERGDIIRTMQRAVTAALVTRAPADLAIYDPGAAPGPLVGRVLARGLADEHADHHYVIVDGTDGRSHFVALGAERASDAHEGMIVRIDPARADLRTSDRTVAAVAAANGGRYSVDAHLRFDASASDSFAEAHVRRLEALRRAGVGVERVADGSWHIPADHLERVAAHEAARVRARPVTLTALSARPLRDLARIEAPTWLDARLANGGALPARDANFGAELRAAEQIRRRWLLSEGLAEERDGQIRPAAGAIETLRRRELLRAATTLSRELGLRFDEPAAGDRLDGVLRRRVDLHGGRYALIERSRDFTLVPWRPVLEAQIGQRVAGIMRDSGISWTLGRGRGGPSIS